MIETYARTLLSKVLILFIKKKNWFRVILVRQIMKTGWYINECHIFF